MQPEVSSNCLTLQYGAENDSGREGLRAWALCTGPCHNIHPGIYSNKFDPK